jgi:hypothetical protein
MYMTQGAFHPPARASGEGVALPPGSVTLFVTEDDAHEPPTPKRTPLPRNTSTASESVVCVRTGTDVQMLSERMPVSTNERDTLLQLTQRDGSFSVDRVTQSEGSSKKLCWGPVIKIGRYRVRREEVSLEGC